MEDINYTIYITTKNELFISDSSHNLLNQNDLRKEDRKAVYEVKQSELKIIPLTSTSLNRSIPYDKNPSPVFLITHKLTLDNSSLNKIIKERRKELDESWAEYFSIGRLLTPYTTKGLPVPPKIREEADKRQLILAKNTPKNLVDRLLVN